MWNHQFFWQNLPIHHLQTSQQPSIFHLHKKTRAILALFHEDRSWRLRECHNDDPQFLQPSMSITITKRLPWTQEQGPNIGWGVRALVKANQQSPILGFLMSHAGFQVFSDRIGPRLRYENSSLWCVIQLCEVWWFLELVKNFGFRSLELSHVASRGQWVKFAFLG